MFLAIVSIPLWVVFEGYNLLIENWYYINLPENLVAPLLRVRLGVRDDLARDFPDGANSSPRLRGSAQRRLIPTTSTCDYRLTTLD